VLIDNPSDAAGVRAYRVGLIVPSSNTTMETEVPELLRRRQQVYPQRFTCHSSRVGMRRVTPAELVRMNRDSDRCAVDLADARCDILAYACLVAVLTEGPGAHVAIETRLAAAAERAGHVLSVVSSAGALVAGLDELRASRIALVAPYPEPLTATVVDYLAGYGIETVDAISLGITDNAAVGRRDPMDLVGIADQLDTSRADAIVLSACVQMPSLPAVPVVESRTGLPVLTAATATVRQILDRLDLDQYVEGGGALLDGDRSGLLT
jgi:maleate isomerase